MSDNKSRQELQNQQNEQNQQDQESLNNQLDNKLNDQKTRRKLP